MAGRLCLLVVTCLAVGGVGAWAQQEPVAPADLTVRVLDESDAPVADQEVVCARWSFADPPRTERVRDDEKRVTDAGGNCASGALTAEEYAVYAFRGDVSAFERVNPRSLQGVFDLRLAAYPPLNIQFRDLHGQPVPGVLVLADKCAPLALSDTDGRVHFPSLNASGLGFLKAGHGFFSYDFPEGDVEIFMTPGAVLEFTVLDEEGKPVTGAEAGYGEYPLKTDVEGKFRTIELPGGTRVSAFASYATDSAQWSGNAEVVVGPGPVQQAEIRLKKTAEVKKSRAVDCPGAPYPPGRVAVAALYAQAEAPRSQGVMTPLNVHHLSGKVVMEGTGKPVQARLYTAFERERYDMKPCGHTNPDGTFRLEMTKLRPYFYVHPVDGSCYAVESPIQLQLDKDMKDLVFTVKPGHSLRGHVTDQDGKPAAGTWVALENFPGYTIQVPSNDRGYFTITHLPPVSGHYTLNAGKDTKVEVPAGTPGTIIDGIVIKLPPADEGSLVEGMVVDGQGAPAGGVSLNFQQQAAGTPLFEQGKTDSRGRFSLRFKNAGPISLKVWKSMQVKMGELESRNARPCPVREGGQFDVAANGPPQRVRVVVDLPPSEIPLVAGWVEDDQGRPVEAKLQLYGESTPQTHSCSNAFLVYNVQSGDPFLLEFTLEGCQARVLEMGRDFALGDRSVRVVMKKGPYAEEESIWASATGRPDTPEAVAGMLMGERVKQQEAEYERLAGRLGGKKPPEETKPLPAPPQPQAPGEVEIVVTDPQGRPIKEITHRAARALGAEYQPEIRQENAVEASDAPKLSQSNPDGRYRVPNMCLIGAPGSASRLVAVRPGEMCAPPLAVVLGPAASVTVRVEDLDGKPLEGVAVGPLDDISLHTSNNYQYLPKTGADGRVRFDSLPSGFYIYAAAMPITAGANSLNGPYEQIAAAKVGWGECAERTINVGTPKPGSMEAMLSEWRQNIYSPEVIDQAVAALDKAGRHDLERIVVKQLRAIPAIVGLNTAQVTVLARAAAALESRKAVEPLQAVFPTARIISGSFFDHGTEAVMETLVRLRGERMTDYFESVAGNAEASRDARVQALIALGRIGTDKAIAAFRRLRDAAYGKNGAPDRHPAYTDGERMAEAAAMILHYIPGEAGTLFAALPADSASVSADHNDGSMSYGHYTLHFHRFGNEWLLLKMEAMPMP